jgi:hypothetical protein
MGTYNMKEKPILFSTPMVKAILDGRKTMTRRVMNPQPDIALGIGEVCKHGSDNANEWIKCCCPYQIGIKLWVRETFRYFDDGDLYYKEYFGDSIPVHSDDDPYKWKWTPSIFMPREASRINLEITNIRVEKLQDTSTEDIKAEGWDDRGLLFPNVNTDYKCRNKWFIPLWDLINAKRGYGWDVNPWVFVIEFKRI